MNKAEAKEAGFPEIGEKRAPYPIWLPEFYVVAIDYQKEEITAAVYVGEPSTYAGRLTIPLKLWKDCFHLRKLKLRQDG